MDRTPRMTEQSAIPSVFTRRRFLSLSALTTAALVTGCGGGEGVGGGSEEGVGGFEGTYEGPALTLAYWNGFTGGDGPAMDALVKKFNADQKNIEVKQNTIEWGDFYTRLPAAAGAGQGPDVGAMHLDQIATHAATKIIVPVDDVAAELNLTEDDFAASVWQPGIWQDKRYGIPLDVHCLGMYYNKDHFEQAGIDSPPTDAASLDEACQKLQQAGIENPFWMPNQWPAHLMFLSLLWQFGGEPYGGDGSEATFGSEQGVSALTWMQEQIDKGYSPANVDIDAQYTAFKNGENSITWDGIWQINDLEESGMNWGIAALPTIGEQLASWANSHNFFLTSQAAEDTDRSNASKVFIGWMSSQSAAWSDAGMIPALNEARESSDYQDSPQAALGEQVDNLHFLPAVPGLGAVQAETLELAVNKALLGQSSVEDALSEAQGNATELMQKNQEKFGG